MMEEVRFMTRFHRELPLSYNGLASKEVRGRKITVFNVNPSNELRKFRSDLYQAIRGMIWESPRTSRFNRLSEDEFWFHATVSMKSGLSIIRQLKETISPSSRVESTVERISLLKFGKIVYEYDTTTGRILNRSQALQRSLHATGLVHRI